MGKLVVIEGMDGAGTTTQTKMLCGHLKAAGFKVANSAEPTKSCLGQEIRKWLAQPIEGKQDLLTMLALCFAADRMQHVHEILKPRLLDSDFVILDRYVMSSLVYQGIHLPSTFIKEINQYAIKPALSVVVDIDPKVAIERIGMRKAANDFYESVEFLDKIRGRYLHFAKSEPSSCVLVDGSGSAAQVHSHILHVLRDKFNEDKKI